MGRLAQTTTIELQGRPYSLLLDMNGMVAFEQEMGESFFTFAERANVVGYQPTAKELRALLWAEMLHAQPEVTIQEAGALITAEDLQPILTAVMTASSNAAPAVHDEDPDPDPNATSRPIG